MSGVFSLGLVNTVALTLIFAALIANTRLSSFTGPVL